MDTTTQTTSSTERTTTTKAATTRTSTSEKYGTNMTSNVTAITTVIGNIVLKVTTRKGETTITEAIPKVPQVPEAKASGSGGEEDVLLDLLRLMYFTYRFMKGTLMTDLCSDVLVVRIHVCYAK